MLAVLQIQPLASTTMLNLLVQTIQKAQSDIDASIASIQEVKRNWNL